MDHAVFARLGRGSKRPSALIEDGGAAIVALTLAGSTLRTGPASRPLTAAASAPGQAAAPLI